MGERDNHIDQGTSLSPQDELLTHIHGEKERVVDREVQLGGDEAQPLLAGLSFAADSVVEVI